MNMSFANNSFGIIFSNLFLHNIYNKEGRYIACKEISRALKKGGTGIIADFSSVRLHIQLDVKNLAVEYIINFLSLLNIS